MKHPYEDILNLPRHVSSRHARMSLQDRAAQFSPFAALTGYDAAIQETARLTERQIFLDVDGQAELSDQLMKVWQRMGECPQVTITHFIPDLRKAGGKYVTVTARVQKMDSIRKWLLLDNGEQIFFDDILSIQETW